MFCCSRNTGGSTINEIGEPPSSAPQSHSPVQTVLQRSLYI
ncbi:MAG: hypothetical protein ORN21_04590 [Methylophilaceae bacterium]|nr:hypothetical protein [Methylophilaceae bacterium]